MSTSFLRPETGWVGRVVFYVESNFSIQGLGLGRKSSLSKCMCVTCDHYMSSP